jgi:hypothetical protein
VATSPIIPPIFVKQSTILNALLSVVLTSSSYIKNIIKGLYENEKSA